jgi:exoribonuclease-2
VADVDVFVRGGSATDRAAAQNTTSVYTGVTTFPMLPERLSTDLSSLNEGVKRLAIVIEMLIGTDGETLESSVYPAVVLNRAQLTYDAVAGWLDQNGESRPDPFPSSPESQPGALGEVSRKVLDKIARDPALAEQLKLQDRVANLLRQRRHEAGALNFQTIELHPVVSEGGEALDLRARRQNRAGRLIEDLMIAANRVTASFLENRGFPSMRRVVKTPVRWDRIVALAGTLGGNLPADPDSKSLEAFLQKQHQDNPDHFPDLSLSIIKLLGRGEYVIKSPGETAPGHFSLAVPNYSHSTAPNRRYPDLITQRLLKAAVASGLSPYPIPDLEAIATHCTAKEDDAAKVERFVRKCVAAMVLRPRIGEKFPAIVTGASEKGIWVRITHPPVEGKLVAEGDGLEVGDRVQVRLVATDPEHGFIDFLLSHA